MHVAEIGAESDKMPGDRICVMRALFEGMNRERMTLIPNSELSP